MSGCANKALDIVNIMMYSGAGNLSGRDVYLVSCTCKEGKKIVTDTIKPALMHLHDVVPKLFDQIVPVIPETHLTYRWIFAFCLACD